MKKLKGLKNAVLHVSEAQGNRMPHGAVPLLWTRFLWCRPFHRQALKPELNPGARCLFQVSQGLVRPGQPLLVGAAPARRLFWRIGESEFFVNKNRHGKRQEVVHLEPVWRRSSRQAKSWAQRRIPTPPATPVFYLLMISGRPTHATRCCVEISSTKVIKSNACACYIHRQAVFPAGVSRPVSAKVDYRCLPR